MADTKLAQSSPFVKRDGKPSLSTTRLRERFEATRDGSTDIPALAGARLRQACLDANTAAGRAAAIVYHRKRGKLENLLAMLDDLPATLYKLLPAFGNETALKRFPYPEVTARHLARDIALGLHLQLHRAFDAGLRFDEPRVVTRRLAMQVWEEVQRYEDALRHAREAALNAEPDHFLLQLEIIGRHVAGGLSGLVERVGQASAHDDEGGELGVMISAIGRRYAMLAAAMVLLDHRFRNPRTASTTPRIAESRSRLRRRYLRGTRTVRSLIGLEGRTVALYARLSNVDWVERPNKPYSKADVTGRTGSVVVPHKSMRHQGAAEGVYAWMVGKVKQGNAALGNPYLEVAFEGPGNHEQEVWEDWLATEVRDVYALHPGSLFMEWEFPALGRVGSTADLHARIGITR